MSDFGNVLLVALGIGMLIFVHELGHYLCARWIGVRVEVFSLGFGPRLWGFTREGCDYRVSLIPLGGYVAVAGAEGGDKRYPRSESLHGKTVGQRMWFYSGGVLMNLLFALIAFPVALSWGVAFLAPVVGVVEPGSAAWQAQLQPGDRILSVGGKATYSFDNLAVEVALAGGRPVTLQIERGGEPIEVTVRPQYGDQAGLFRLGVTPANEPEEPVLSIEPQSAAAEAGLRSGDRVVEVDGRSTVREAQALTEVMRPLSGPYFDRPVAVEVERDGLRIRVDLVRTPAAKEGSPLLGVTNLPRRVAGVRDGSSVLSELTLQSGDVILAIDGRPYRGPDMATALQAESLDAGRIVVTVQRGDRRLELVASCSSEERQDLAEHVALVGESGEVVLDPSPDGAARAAGILAGDRLLAVDGTAVTSWQELIAYMSERKAETVRLDVERHGASLAAGATRWTVPVQAKATYDLGISWTIDRLKQIVVADGVVDAVGMGSVFAVDLIKQLYVTMKRLLTGDVAAKNLGGIIQISRVSYHNVQWGFCRFLYFLALLSINLAFVNVLPIPVLDGGYLTFLLIERIKGSPVSTKVHTYSQVLGLVFILALVVFVTYNDILKLL